MPSLAQHFVTVTLDSPPKPSQLYQLGWNAYCNGFPAYDKLESKDERRGYMAANRHDAETAAAGDKNMSW